MKVERKAYQPKKAMHPGKTLREKLEEMGMTPMELAQRTSISIYAITSVLDGDASVSADMALAFEHVTQIPARFWLNTQHSYDEYMLKSNPENYRVRLAQQQKREIIIFMQHAFPGTKGDLIPELADYPIKAYAQ